MSPVEHASTPVEKLHGLVIADEFRRWLGSGPDADIVPELPGESASHTAVVNVGGRLNSKKRRWMLLSRPLIGLRRDPKNPSKSEKNWSNWLGGRKLQVRRKADER